MRKLFQMTKSVQIFYSSGEGEAPNLEAILFSNLTFEKADLEKVKNKTRKRLPLVAGKQKRCSTPLFASC